MNWLSNLVPCVVGLVGALAVLAGAYALGKANGRAELRAEYLQAGIEKQKRINDAENSAPRTPGELDKRLRDGRF